jgi:PST family polysaccharide transporter
MRAFPWKVKFTWNSAVARELWKYGFHMVTAASLYFVIMQVDKLTVGKFLGLAALGYYTVASRWAEFGSRDIVSGIGSVLFPTFSAWHAAGLNSAEKIERVMQV